ncbi:MAG TPA: hypothetical protein VK580_06415 [Steroidobacteraceae bacterium]|nr:hypothetical protein [Steroidobacteraceae bacterium]
MKIRSAFQNIWRMRERLDAIGINQGLILSALNETRNSTNLVDYEFKVFSQWGEDGIIQYLSKAIELKHKTFIEFGVESFMEANCRFLLMKDNWSGYVIDASSSNISIMKNSYFYWKHQIDAVDAFVTKDNINDLLAKSCFDKDVGILSIDIDGNDYFILEAINTVRPRILICEYNAVFGARKISVPYEPDFCRTRKHYSNLYWGASLSAITFLANRKGYSLVGTNSSGCNAFFVRDDLLNEKVKVLTAEQAFLPSTIRQSRDKQGNLSYLTGDDRLKEIRGLAVVNVETGAIEEL